MCAYIGKHTYLDTYVFGYQVSDSMMPQETRRYADASTLHVRR